MPREYTIYAETGGINDTEVNVDVNAVIKTIRKKFHLNDICKITCEKGDKITRIGMYYFKVSVHEDPFLDEKIKVWVVRDRRKN